MRNKKIVAMLLPLLALTGCGKGNTEHKSLYKEWICNYYEGGEIWDTSKFVYEYDEKGREVFADGYRYNFETKEFVYIISVGSTYDGDKLVREDYYENDGKGGKELVGYYKSAFDGDLLIKYESFDVDGEEESLFEYSLYFYDDNNREIKVETFESDEETGEFVQTGLIETEYEGDSKLPSKVSKYHVEGEEKSFDEIDKYTYDEFGNLISFYEEDDYFGKSYNFFSYTDKGQVSSLGQYVYNEDEGTWEIVNMSDYSYIDGIYENDVCLTRFENGAISHISYECNEYDDDMNITSTKEYSIDLETGEYILRSESIYNY